MSEDIQRQALLKNFQKAGKMLKINESDLEEDQLGELPSITNSTRGNSSALKSKDSENNSGINERVQEEKDIPNWSNFFTNNETVTIPGRNFTFNTYFKVPKDLNADLKSIPIFLAHHGAGSTGLSFAPLAKTLEEELGSSFGFFSFDARGHGQSKPLDPSAVSYYLDDFIMDFVELIVWYNEKYLKSFDQSKLSLVLVGHSLGGSVCTNTFEHLPEYIRKKTIGVAMLDIVEEMAKFVLTKVDHFLAITPNVFGSVSEAIDWYQSHNYSKVKESAEISVPALFHKTKSGKIVRITNLASFKPYWDSWFNGLSAKFVSLPTSKLLILAGNDNLDKELIVGQMQGKYQLIVFRDSGHFIQEDVPRKCAISLVDFWRRSDNKNVAVKSNWGAASKNP